MMNLTLSELLSQWRTATSPTTLFGLASATTADALKRRYRELAAIVHPDHNPTQRAAAEEAFKLLQQWYAVAHGQTNSNHAPSIVDITTKRHRYTSRATPIAGDLCDLFAAEADGAPVLLKIVRDGRNNDLLQTEAQTLRRISRATEGQPVRAHFPTLIEHCALRDAAGRQRQVNVLQNETAYVSLAAVARAYPTGLDLADAAWMFNRMLAALGVIHGLGIVHGALTLDHMLIRPADHNGMLIDWAYSGPFGEPIKAVSPPYQADYPPEVWAKQPASAATDLYMAARSLLRLLGGAQSTPGANLVLPDRVPKLIRELLRGCLLPAPQRRMGDAWELFTDFQAILERLYGPRVFRPFTL
ncbi:MAG: DnaJ domain-containing protein [Chloroflexi bacterium]|nr:DnaJ domain-containing protein [Chloroflexota bacterium]